MNPHDRNKAALAPLRAALYDMEPESLRTAFRELFAPDARIVLCAPFEEVDGPDDLFERAYAPLIDAMPDIERRDFIFMAGPRFGEGATGNWVGLGGNFVGRFDAPWLGIPPTRRPAFMRYHEYYRVEDGRIAEMSGLWDIPQVMMQAGAWPLAPQLGVEWMCLGPAGGDGIVAAPHDRARGDASVRLVLDMLMGLRRSPEGVAAMRLDDFWHPKCMWYGPAGIGTGRRVEGFRSVHQIPFLNGMPDRRSCLERGVFFGDRDLVAFTGWPSGVATHTGDGFLGLAPTGKRFTRRSLDFWRCENGLIRENWVLVDMLHIYGQLGIDVFARMREMLALPGDA